MSPLFPSSKDLQGIFQTPLNRRQTSFETKRTTSQADLEHYTAWSTIDDVKDKANKLSNEAAKEFEKASAKAQAKTGTIELYSPKFYAACTLGGLLACVSSS